MDFRGILFGVKLAGNCVYSVPAALGLTLVALAPLIISFFRHEIKCEVSLNASLWPHSRHKIFYGGIGAPYFYVLYYDILANNEFCYFNSIIVCFFRQGIFYYFCILIVFYDCFQLIIIKGFYQLACWPSYTCYQEWVTSFLLLIL